MRTNRLQHILGSTPPRRVLILRALKLGDLLCAVPAFRALRGALPTTELVLLGLPWAREYVARYRAYLDDFREFPGYPGLPEQPVQQERFAAFLTGIRQERFDLVLQMHGDGSVTNGLVAQLGARRVAGWYPPEIPCPDPDRFAPYREDGSEVQRLLRLLNFLGIEAQDEELEFPVLARDRQELQTISGAADLQPRQYVCVHPGASVPERRWPPEYFAWAAQALADQGFRIVLTGTQGESELTRAVAGMAGVPCLDLAGRTGLGPLAALLQDARLLLCNDTGVSHLAAALRVPSVVLGMANNLARWAPADQRRHRVLCRETGAGPHDILDAAQYLLDDFDNSETRFACDRCVS